MREHGRYICTITRIEYNIMVLRFGCTERVNDSMVVIFGLLRDFIYHIRCWDLGVPNESYKCNNRGGGSIILEDTQNFESLSSDNHQTKINTAEARQNHFQNIFLIAVEYRIPPLIRAYLYRVYPA